MRSLGKTTESALPEQNHADAHDEDSHFKRPFGVEGEVSNGRPIKLGFLIAGLG